VKPARYGTTCQTEKKNLFGVEFLQKLSQLIRI